MNGYTYRHDLFSIDSNYMLIVDNSFQPNLQNGYNSI